MPLKFKLNASMIADALYSLKKIVPDANQDVCTAYFFKDRIQFFLKSNSKATEVSKVVHVKVSGLNKGSKGEPTNIVGLNVGVLSGICYNRGELTFEIDDKRRKLSFTSNGAYKGHMGLVASTENIPDDDHSDKAGTKLAFGEDFRKTFAKAVKAVHISDVLAMGTVLDADVQISMGKMEILVADHFHAAYTKIAMSTKGKGKKDLHTKFPIQYLSMIDSFFKTDKKYALLLTDTKLHAWTDSGSITLPLLQSEVIYTMVDFKTNTNKKNLKVNSEYRINTASLEAILSNAESFFSGETMVVALLASGKNLKLNATSSFGSINDVIPVLKCLKAPKGKTKIHLELNTVVDVLATIGGKTEVIMSITNDGSLLTFRCETEGQESFYCVAAYAK